MRISVVVPVLNERDNLPELAERLTRVLERYEDYEIILVDDGSTDGSWSLIRELAGENPKIRGVRLARNFGQHTAIVAGLARARGDVVAVMDADLQEPPEELPKLVDKLREGYWVVFGRRGEGGQSRLRRALNALYMRALSFLVGQKIPTGIGAFRAMRREVAEALASLPEHTKVITSLSFWMGWPWTWVPVEHHPRRRGKTKYSPARLFFLFLDATLSYSMFPLRILAVLGLGISFLAFLGAVYIVVRKLAWGIPVLGWASTITLILLLGGLIIAGLGLIGEYLGRVYREVLGRPHYVVLEETDASSRRS